MKEIGGICGIRECYHIAVPALLDYRWPFAHPPSSASADCYRRIAPWPCPARGRASGALNRRFAGVVPKAVALACRVAAIQDDVALVYCANGAAASRVRAQAKGVAQALAQAGAPVAEVKVKVRADWSLPERPEKHDMPAAALGAFRELENTLPDGALKDAVERLLARRHSA
jgi:hypothetical protein